MSALDAGSHPTPLLVRARPSGSRPPLFLLFSDESALVSLHQFLGAFQPDQPVYGLLPARRERRFDRSRTVEDLACGLLQLIREVQPRGPYYLCGHALGGVLAYEVARQLRLLEEEVGLLAVLDAMTPGSARRWLKHWSRPGSRLRRQLRRGLRQPAVELRGVAGREAQADLNGLQLVSASSAPNEFDGEGAVAIGLKYRPGPYAGPIVLFTTAASRAAAERTHLGWEDVKGGPTAFDGYEVPGHPLTMLKEPYVALVADRLAGCLEQAQAAHLARPLAAAG